MKETIKKCTRYLASLTDNQKQLLVKEVNNHYLESAEILVKHVESQEEES